MFLWHYPHGHPHWALPSKFGLSEARTFLGWRTIAEAFATIRNCLRLLFPIFSLVLRGGDVGPFAGLPGTD